MRNRISSIMGMLVNYKTVFTSSSFKNFTALAKGWILCTSNHSISKVIQFIPEGWSSNHSRFYNFFSRAKWEPDDLSMHLLPMVLDFIPEEMIIHASVDDTLAHRSGSHIWGAGMHYDAVTSNYGRGETRVTVFAFGLSWVIVSLLVPVPWNRNHLLALPVLFRLYRSKKTCPPDDYKTRSELAAELIEKLCRWLPSNRHLRIVGDDEYATKTVASRIAALEKKAAKNPQSISIPESITLCGPMTMKAEFYAVPDSSQKGRGRPRKKGSRLPSPRKLAEDCSVSWETKEVYIYGRNVEILTKTQVGLWYHTTGTRPVRMVLTRDPKGRIDDRAYFITDATLNLEHIIISYSYRWSQEVLHRNLKQYFGLNGPQNGWWRRPSGQRRDSRQTGPAAHESRGRKASTRTVPFILVLYSTLEIWYLTHGDPVKDVQRARNRAPWNVRKSEPSFIDRLAAARREILYKDIFEETTSTTGFLKIDLAFVELLLAA